MNKVGRPVVHGARVFDRAGERALSVDQLTALEGIKATIRDRAGIEEAMVRHCALTLMIVEVLAAYIEGETRAGTPPDTMPSLMMFASYLNSAARQLKTLREMHIGKDAPGTLEGLMHGD